MKLKTHKTLFTHTYKSNYMLTFMQENTLSSVRDSKARKQLHRKTKSRSACTSRNLDLLDTEQKTTGKRKTVKVES